MGENSREAINNGTHQFSSIDKSLERKSVSFRKDPFQAHMDWLERNMGTEAAQKTSEKIVKFMLKAEAKGQIGVMKMFLKADTQRADEYFDKTRKIVVGIVQGLPNYPLFEEQGVGKQAEIQRWLISIYVGGLLNAAQSNTQFDTAMKGIAWSILAKDARNVLAERGQTINNEWLFNTMGPLIRTNKDPKAIGEELSRFTQGNPQVIQTKSPSSL